MNGNRRLRVLGLLSPIFLAAACVHQLTTRQVGDALRAERYEDVVRMVGSIPATDVYYPQFLQMRGQANLALSRPAAAIRDFTALLRVMPKFAYVRMLRGDAYKAINQLDSALDDYSTAIQQEPSLSAEVYSNRAEVRLGLGDRERSAEDLTWFMKLGQQNLLARATSCLNKGDSGYAFAVLQRAEFTDTTSWQMLLLHGLALSLARMDSAAAREYNRGLIRAVPDTVGLAVAADWFFDNRAYWWADRAYAELMAREPGSAHAVEQRALSQMHLNQVDTALVLLSKAIVPSMRRADSARTAELCFRRGEIYERKGMSADAAVDFGRAGLYAPGVTFARILPPEVKPPEPPAETARADSTSAVAADTLDVPNRDDVFVLAVGVASHELPEVAPCPFARDDAEAFVRAMTSRTGGRVPESNARILLDSAATGSKIKKNLAWLTAQAKAKNGTAIFYYSGHGAARPATGEDASRRFLVAFDCDLTYLEETGLAVDDVEGELATVGPGRTFAALDACFSGRGRSLPVPGQRGITPVRKVPKRAEQPVPPVTMLTACATDEAAADYDATNHGLFTYYLLSALSGHADDLGNRDGWVQPGEAWRYVADIVAAQAMSLRNMEQHPQLSGRPDAMQLSPNPQMLRAASKERKLARLSDAYNARLISAEQLSRAVKEVESGTCSPLLSDFLNGVIPATTFGKTYLSR